MRHFIFILAVLLFVNAAPVLSQAGSFGGYKIFINPGHGGHDSNDRHMTETDFWESDGNLTKGLWLRDLLVRKNAQVYMSRTTNNTADDLALSAIYEMANAAGVDFFLSIHSNGFDGKQNQPLMLFRGYDNSPVFPEAKVFAGILWQNVFNNGNCWTNSSVWVKGDWTFYPEWQTQGLGVLRGLTMPGVLSEGSFHDYVAEGWRLRNSDFLLHESWAFLRSFMQYRNLTAEPTGIIAGIVRDPDKSPSYYYKTGTKDRHLPINGSRVVLENAGKEYITDNLNNGFFLFDSLAPGTYKVVAGDVENYLDDSVTVQVNAGISSLVSLYQVYDTAMVPVVLSLDPVTSDSVSFNQKFTVNFSIPMNRDSVSKSLSLLPSVPLSLEWNSNSTAVTVKPVTGYSSKTVYTVTLGSIACSKWKVAMASDYSFGFVTRNRPYLKVLQQFPQANRENISLYPRIMIWFDALPQHSSASDNIRIFDESLQQLGKIRESSGEKEGRGYYAFETAQPLGLSKVYSVVINKELTDITGTKPDKSSTVVFTARKAPYNSGSVVESFDDASVFWDPDASGSTTGTDNPLTLFGQMQEIKRGGTGSGKLDYVFINSNGGVCRVFDTRKPSVGQDASKYFGMWVYGDMSYNRLEFWFYSSGSTNQIVVADTIDWAGWEFVQVPLSSVGGSGDKLYHSIVIRQTQEGARTGTLLFDEAQLITTVGTGDEMQFNSNISLSLFPNPVRDRATVKIAGTEGMYISLLLTDIAGRRVEEVYSGRSVSESVEIPWNPSPNSAPGIYVLRLEAGKKGSPEYTVRSVKAVLEK